MVDIRSKPPIPHRPRTSMITPGIMTVTVLQCDDKMSLFQDLKLKIRKVDSRTSPDSAGDGYPELRSSDDYIRDEDCVDARVFDGGGHQEVSSSPQVMIGLGAAPRPSDELMSIDSPQPDTSDHLGYVSSCSSSSQYLQRASPNLCPIGLNGLSIQPSMQLDQKPIIGMNGLSVQPQTPSMHIDQKPVIVASVGNSMSPSIQQKALLGLNGLGVQSHWSSMHTDQKPIIVSSVGSSVHHNRYHGQNSIHYTNVKAEVIGGNSNGSNSYNVSSVSSTPSTHKTAYTPKMKTPTVIMGESGGVKTMVWTTPANQSSPREVLSSSSGPTSMYSADTTDAAVRASVDGLLSLGQERRGGSPQMSPSSTLSVSPSARSPIMSSSRSPHIQSSRHSPYTTTPSSPIYPHPSRSLHSPQNSIGDIQPSQYTNYNPSQSGLDSPRVQHPQSPLNMEKLWAGDRSQVPHDSQSQQSMNHKMGMEGLWSHNQPNSTMDTVSNSATAVGLGANMGGGCAPMEDEEDQPMICMICEDRATGLHYGIITCEGCKGFFKRTVQNKRVYTCVAEGKCEITKAQRNRCQYCRFKKCLKQGMVLAAVREDRMPGGRNSGAVYNLYKVKYKKKKNQKNGQVRQNQFSPDKSKMAVHENMMPPNGTCTMPMSSSPSPMSSPPVSTPQLPPGIGSGNILKAALMGPNNDMGMHFRYRPEGNVTSSRSISSSTAQNMIQILLNGDDFEDFATLRNMEDLLDMKSDWATTLCKLFDSIGMKLVKWTKGLPFYREVPVEVHTQLLTSKWHELLVLTTSTYLARFGNNRHTRGVDGTEAEFRQEMSNNLSTLQNCLASMMGSPSELDTFRQDMEATVEKITHVTFAIRRLKIENEEYVCLKVIALLNHAKNEYKDLEDLQEKYISCLRYFCEANFPNQPRRVEDLLVILNDINSAAVMLRDSKMFYIPFLICSTVTR